MSKKHYEAIAAIIASTYRNAALYNDAGRLETLETTAARLADYFATDNPRFDRERFLAACGIGETCRHCGEYHTDGLMHECPDNR